MSTSDQYKLKIDAIILTSSWFCGAIYIPCDIDYLFVQSKFFVDYVDYLFLKYYLHNSFQNELISKLICYRLDLSILSRPAYMVSYFVKFVIYL